VAISETIEESCRPNDGIYHCHVCLSSESMGNWTSLVYENNLVALFNAITNGRKKRISENENPKKIFTWPVNCQL
jgi:hypothetical protein